MAREWQQTRFPEFVMPDAVYYQSIWAVRDLSRMEKRVMELENDRQNYGRRDNVVKDRRVDYRLANPTEKRALEKVLLENRIKAIYSALNIVPESYRKFIYENITIRKEPAGFHTKIWKIWKQRFLYHVAKNLSLM